MRSALSPAPNRRLLMAGAGAALLLPASASAECRIRGYRSRSACATQCTEPVTTLDCQQHAMFPTEDDISRGTITGAILGGAIAYAMGRPDLVLGAIVAGGVIGGIVQGRENYIRHQVARAGGDVGRAFQETTQDRRAGEYNIAQMAYEPVAMIQSTELSEINDILDRLAGIARPPREVMRRLEPVVERIEARATLLGAATTNSDQSLVVLDDATTDLGRAVGARPPAPNAASRGSISARSAPTAPAWSLYFRVRANPVYASISGRG